jgi:hypothetical protein
VSWAGYIPQLFSLRLPSPDVIFELLQKANAKALIYDASCQSILVNNGSPVPIFFASNPKDGEEMDEHLPDFPKALNGKDTAFILHSSGSTSGILKLVPWTYSWLDNAIDKSGQFNRTLRTAGRPIITAWTGNVCHAGQNFCPCNIFYSSGLIVAYYQSHSAA